MTTEIICGDALTVLRTLPSDHFHCVVTSPPYYSLRDYGTGAWDGGDLACDHRRQGKKTGPLTTLRVDGRDHVGPYENERALTVGHPYPNTCGKCGARRVDQQIGLEATPDLWVARLVEVFREVRRVLRPDGVCWINCGDSYASSPAGATKDDPFKTSGLLGGLATGRVARTVSQESSRQHGLKPKDLIGQPWLLAFALRADGWWLRSEIIWAKPNPMPESVTDRPTKAHEQVFLLTKSPRYYFDQEAVREPGGLTGHRDNSQALHSPGNKNQAPLTNHFDGHLWRVNPAGRNMRSVWTIATDPLPSVEVDGEKLDHFASYPIELARRCILAGTSAKGCCPECGAPWARTVERESGQAIEVRGYQAGVNRQSPFITHGQGSPNAVGFPNSMQLAPRVHSETTGWQPTCSCAPAKPESCRVLDCFGGSGRTALAAEELQRDCTLIELNPKSVAMAHAQLERAKARRMIGAVTDRTANSETQLRLFA